MEMASQLLGVSPTAMYAIGILAAVVGLAVTGLLVASMWKIYGKAGKPGWASLIPIYNTFVMLDIVGKPGIWFLYLLIPFVNVIFAIKLTFALARSFGKDTGFALGLLMFPLVFIPLLGFGNAEHQGTPALATAFRKAA
jgi:hypothetical protein